MVKEVEFVLDLRLILSINYQTFSCSPMTAFRGSSRSTNGLSYHKSLQLHPDVTHLSSMVTSFLRKQESKNWRSFTPRPLWERSRE
jgi:hypothetical protein